MLQNVKVNTINVKLILMIEVPQESYYCIYSQTPEAVKFLQLFF